MCLLLSNNTQGSLQDGIIVVVDEDIPLCTIQWRTLNKQKQIAVTPYDITIHVTHTVTTQLGK